MMDPVVYALKDTSHFFIIFLASANRASVVDLMDVNRTDLYMPLGSR